MGYDYTQAGCYYITICTKDRHEFLGKHIVFINDGSVKTDPYIELTECGMIAESELLNITAHFNYVSIDQYVIMPNHIHVIVTIHAETVGAGLDQPTISADRTARRLSIPQIIGLYKSGVTRLCNKDDFICWQRGYYEHIIRDEQELQIKREYIKNNPVKWEEDEFNSKTHFPCYYSSSGSTDILSHNP